MAEMSRRFNFDDFDEQIAEALEENQEAMHRFQTPKVTEIPPGEIGGVLIRATFGKEDPPDIVA